MSGKGSNLSKSFGLLDFFHCLLASFFATLNIGLFFRAPMDDAVDRLSPCL